jgi:hypothetical protein
MALTEFMIDRITMDPEIQARVELDQSTIDEYASEDTIDRLPPVNLHREEETSMSAKKPKFEFLPIDSLVLDPDIQPRVEIEGGVVDDYKEIIEAHKGPDAAFPPVDVFHDGTTHRLADGFHRALAYKEAGHVMIGCHVHEGGKRDAILFSVGTNAKHGLRRTNSDKRRVVEIVLKDEEWSKFSDRKIAEIVGVNHRLVASVRQSLGATGGILQSNVRKGADGRTTNVSKIGKSAKSSQATNAPDQTAKPEALKGQSRVDGVLQDDPPDIAKLRAAGKIAKDVIPEITTAIEEDVKAAQDDAEAQEDARKERDAIQNEVSDESWLKELPLSAVLKGKPLRIFRDDALFYRQLEKVRESLKRKSSELHNKSQYIGAYGHKTRSWLITKAPDQWKPCPEPKNDGCSATGQTPLGECGKCRGRGYIIF